MFATEMPCAAGALCAKETVARQSRVALPRIEKGRVMRVVNRFLQYDRPEIGLCDACLSLIIGHTCACPKFHRGRISSQLHHVSLAPSKTAPHNTARRNA